MPGGGVRISFRLEATALTAALGRYLDAVKDGKPREQLIADQMRLAIKAIVDLTPPDTYAQGRLAVKRDITNAMSPWGGPDGQFRGIKDEGLRERLVEYSAAGEYDKLKQVWASIGGKSALRLLDFDEDLHHRVQNSRGHVPSPQNIMVPQVKEWKNYVAKVQGQVGRARGGWAASAELVGLSLPSWVTRHSEGGDASQVTDPGRVTFTFINRAVFVPRYRQNVELALAGREKAMANDARRFLAGAKTHAGLGNR